MEQEKGSPIEILTSTLSQVKRGLNHWFFTYLVRGYVFSVFHCSSTILIVKQNVIYYIHSNNFILSSSDRSNVPQIIKLSLFFRYFSFPQGWFFLQESVLQVLGLLLGDLPESRLRFDQFRLGSAGENVWSGGVRLLGHFLSLDLLSAGAAAYQFH